MKVCAVTTWPPHRDGVALYSAELYKQLSELAHIEVIGNITDQQVITESRRSGNLAVLRCWKRGLLYPLHVFRSVLKSGCHVVHLQHGWLLYGGFISFLLFPILLAAFRVSHKSSVVTMHTVIRKDAHIYENFLVNCLAMMAVLLVSKSVVHFSDKVIVHNSLMKKILQTEYGADEEKIVVIPHGIKKAAKEPESSKKSNELCILSLGFLRKEKRIDCLIEAFEKFVEKVPNAKLVLVGGKHAHDKVAYPECFERLLSPKIQKHVFFAGFVDEKRLNRLIWSSDIIVLQYAKPCYVEASGTLAAVADYGKPVVCGKVSKFQSELQNGEHYVAVENFDSTELSQALVLLTENRELRDRIGKNLKNRFRDRSWSNVAKEHINLYRSLILGK